MLIAAPANVTSPVTPATPTLSTASTPAIPKPSVALLSPPTPQPAPAPAQLVTQPPAQVQHIQVQAQQQPVSFLYLQCTDCCEYTYIISATDPAGGFTSNGDLTVYFDTKPPACATLIGHIAQWSENYYYDRYLRVLSNLCASGINCCLIADQATGIQTQQIITGTPMVVTQRPAQNQQQTVTHIRIQPQPTNNFQRRGLALTVSFVFVLFISMTQ